MKIVSFQEYQAAKLEIIGGVEYEESSMLKSNGRIIKQYITEKNGTFYEATELGLTEFWSDKHSESCYYDDRTREETMPNDFLVQLITIIKDMKTTGSASLHELDAQTNKKLNLLLDEMIEAAELTRREIVKEAV